MAPLPGLWGGMAGLAPLDPPLHWYRTVLVSATSSFLLLLIPLKPTEPGVPNAHKTSQVPA